MKMHFRLNKCIRGKIYQTKLHGKITFLIQRTTNTLSKMLLTTTTYFKK